MEVILVTSTVAPSEVVEAECILLVATFAVADFLEVEDGINNILRLMSLVVSLVRVDF